MKKLILIVVLLAVLLSACGEEHSYTIYFKDGSQIQCEHVDYEDSFAICYDTDEWDGHITRSESYPMDMVEKVVRK